MTQGFSSTDFYRPLGRVHFVGIGGIGMSGLAEFLARRGQSVQGSDLAANAQTQRLQKLGVKIFLGHKRAHVREASYVVASSAIGAHNPEWLEAMKLGLVRLRRADMLSGLLQHYWTITVAGTHGKTTTTSLVSAVMEAGGLAPSVLNGGIMRAYRSNARVGRSRWMVAEADESDGSFLQLPSQLAVLTNIDAEHLGHYQNSRAALRKAFAQYSGAVAFYGCVIWNHEDRALARIARGLARRRRVLSYGLDAGADVRASRVQTRAAGMNFRLHVSAREGAGARTSDGWHLAMHGEHNLRNALAAVAVGCELKIPLVHMRRALAEFRGTERRFREVGRWQGARIYDDYAHHPTEIAVTLQSARALTKKRVLAVVQPHRYSRVQALAAEYVRALKNADAVLLLPIYAAGEAPLRGVSSAALARQLAQSGKDARAIAPEDLASAIVARAQKDDVIICMGAGSISALAQDLARACRSVSKPKGKVR